MKTISVESPLELVKLASNGNPLVTQLLIDNLSEGKDPQNALDSTLSLLVKEQLPQEISSTAELYEQYIRHISMLSLVGIQFRVQDVTHYLFPDDKEAREKANIVCTILQESKIITYRQKGYELDPAIGRVAALSLMLNAQEYPNTHMHLLLCAIDLQSQYPTATERYKNMVVNPYFA